MGQRDSRIGRAAAGRGDAGDDLEGDALAGQRLDLLAAASEDEGVAALQPQDPLALPRELDQQRGDLGLGQGVVLGHLADIDALRVAAHQVEDRLADQPVVEHHVGLLHQAQGPEGEQVRIPGAGADEVDLAQRQLALGLFGPRDDLFHERARGLVLTGEQAFGHRPVDDVLPEAPPQGTVGQAPLHPLPVAARETREPPVGAGQQGLEARLQEPGQGRRVAAGRNRHDKRRAVDHRGHDEAAQLGAIDDVDRDTRRRGQVVQALVFGHVVRSADRQATAGERLRRQRPLVVSDALARRQQHEVLVERRCDEHHFASGTEHELHLARRLQAAAAYQGAPPGQFHEDRQIIHVETLEMSAADRGRRDATGGTSGPRVTGSRVPPAPPRRSVRRPSGPRSTGPGPGS